MIILAPKHYDKRNLIKADIEKAMSRPFILQGVEGSPAVCVSGSIGVASDVQPPTSQRNPKNPLAHLLSVADAEMYIEKKRKAVSSNMQIDDSVA